MYASNENAVWTCRSPKSGFRNGSASVHRGGSGALGGATTLGGACANARTGITIAVVRQRINIQARRMTRSPFHLEWCRGGEGQAACQEAGPGERGNQEIKSHANMRALSRRSASPPPV